MSICEAFHNVVGFVSKNRHVRRPTQDDYDSIVNNWDKLRNDLANQYPKIHELGNFAHIDQVLAECDQALPVRRRLTTYELLPGYDLRLSTHPLFILTTMKASGKYT
jgi:hypothetical protein